MLHIHAYDFGLAQRRKRLFVLAVNEKRASNELLISAEDVLRCATETYLPALKIKPPAVAS